MPSNRNRYNTPLTPNEQADYQHWLASQSLYSGRDISRDLEDYDVQGLYQSLGQSNKFLTPGHGPDTFKKPSHPTFSAESKYSTAQTPGGAWIGNSFIPSPQMQQDTERMHWLREYMRAYEPNVELVIKALDEKK